MMNAWNCPALNDPFYAGMDAMGKKIEKISQRDLKFKSFFAI